MARTCAQHKTEIKGTKKSVDEKSEPFDLCVLTAIQGEKKASLTAELLKQHHRVDLCASVWNLRTVLKQFKHYLTWQKGNLFFEDGEDLHCSHLLISPETWMEKKRRMEDWELADYLGKRQVRTTEGKKLLYTQELLQQVAEALMCFSHPFSGNKYANCMVIAAVNT